MATLTHVSSPASGAIAQYELVDILISAGWEILMWSDGTTYVDATSSPLTANPFGSGASGAGNLGNTGAWWRAVAPDGSREWLGQRGSSDAAGTINRSAAGFSGGSPGATTLPTATDSTALFSATAIFTATPGRLFISADDADGFGWRLMCIPSGGGNVRTLIFDEPLDSPDPSDTDPFLWGGYYNATGLTIYAAGAAAEPSGAILIYKRFTVAGSNQRVAFLTYCVATSPAGPPSSVNGAGLPSNQREVPFDIKVTRHGTPGTSVGWCGIARTLRWATVQGRANGQTSGLAPYYGIYAGGLYLPWDSSTPSLS